MIVHCILYSVKLMNVKNIITTLKNNGAEDRAVFI